VDTLVEAVTARYPKPRYLVRSTLVPWRTGCSIASSEVVRGVRCWDAQVGKDANLLYRVMFHLPSQVRDAMFRRINRRRVLPAGVVAAAASTAPTKAKDQ